MHPQAYEWVARHSTAGAVAVLDIGGRDINGSCRALFPNAAPYVVLDIRPGPDVDIVADAATWRPTTRFDVVVCAEVFEHTDVWPGICRTAFEVLHPGGLFIVTCAGPGRPVHSAVDGLPDLHPGEWYGNVAAADLFDVLADLGFAEVETRQETAPCDTRAVATKPAEPGQEPREWLPQALDHLRREGRL